MAVSLQQLEDDWLNYKPAIQRSRGGRRSLMGFDYQISLSLNSFYNNVLKNNNDAILAFEGLSDLSEVQKEIIYLTQIKTTLTQERIKDSIHEFLAVDSFLEKQHPEIRSKVHYQIACKATKGTLRQDPSDAELGLDPDEARNWARLRPQVLPYVIQGDPSLELAIKLWNKVSRPFDFIAASRGIILNSLGANESSDRICQKLLEQWQNEQISTPPPGELLTPSVFQDSSEDQSRILVGQRPSIEDLNDGCFMPRDSLVSKVLERLDSAATYDAEKGSRKLPIVWISGGSGVGKSALLLQTLQTLVIERDLPVNYLRQFSDQLPNALTYWSKQGTPSLIAVDDLYAPDYRDVALWSNVSRVAFEAPYTTILTCGPDDYREAFEQYAQAQGVMTVIPVDVPALSSAERDSYREWYRVRTQQEEVKQLNETNFVVAAFLLERRRKGDADIGEFAARFSQRLSQHGLTEEFLTSLAVNRLGLEAPMSLFQGKRDAVAQLVNEGLVQLVESPDEEAHVLWFHSALAQKIYNILTPPAKVETRANHFVRYFSATFADSDRPIAFLRLLNLEKQGRIPPELVKETLKKFGEVLRQKHPPELNIGYLFKFREALPKANLQFDKIVPPGLLRTWMASPGVNAEAWSLLWQLLWDCSSEDERDELIPATLDWLQANLDLEPWNYLWQKLWDRTNDKALIELARLWLIDHSDARGWSFVFKKLVAAGIREDWLLQNGIAGLANSPVTTADKYLWSIVESLGPDPSVFLTNLTKRLSTSKLSHITRLGVEAVVNRISQVGLEPIIEGLSADSNGPGWTFLFLGILDSIEKYLSPAELERYTTLAKNWLGGHEERPEWNYVWQRLLDCDPDDEKLWKQGRAWLENREDKPEWNYIWQRLIDRIPGEDAPESNHERDSLTNLGRSWLFGREEKEAWYFVWRRLLDYDDDVELPEQGRAWLAGHEDKPAWALAWQDVLKHYPNDAELLKQGREWLAGHEHLDEWCFVWRRLLDYDDDVELLDQGRAWLAGREDSAVWSLVWQRLLERYPRDAELLQMGRAWLIGRNDRPAYAFIRHRLRFPARS